MKCYIYNCGNLYQITTSRNKDWHASFRSNRMIISKLSDFYLCRWEYNELWIRKLCIKTAEAYNQISLNLQHIPELQKLIREISIFALMEINSQIINAKNEKVKGITHVWMNGCECSIYYCYGLPCWHMISIDDTVISLDMIGEFWYFKIWQQGSIQLNVL